MFAIMYETEGSRAFKVYNELHEAQDSANNIACSGIEVTVFAYDVDSEIYLEFYTI